MRQKHLAIIIVVCLTAAGAISFITLKKPPTGIESISAADMVWVKCTECMASYQMGKKDYYESVQKQREANPMSTMDVPLVCGKCGKESLRLARKCANCGQVVFAIEVAGDNKCPACGQSGF
jgi:hypothetical protein